MLRRIRRTLRRLRRRVRRRRAYGGFYRLPQPHRRRHRRHRILRIVGLVAIALIALAIWDVSTIAHDANAARARLAGTVGDAQKITDDAGRRELTDRLSAAQHDIAAARRRNRVSIPLHLAWFVPGLHRSVTGLTQLIDDADAAASLGKQSIDDMNASQAHIALDDGHVPLDQMQHLQHILSDRSVALRTLVRSAHGMLGPVRSARAEFNDIVGHTADRANDAARGLQVGAALLGAKGPRTFVFGFQNNAEMRDSGMILSYGVASAADGRIKFDHTGPIEELGFQGSPALPTPPGLLKLFGDLDPTHQWRSINATADWSWTGQAAAAMYRQSKGRSIDGLIGVDVPALASVLKVIGPVDLDGRGITSDNVATVLLHDAYATNDQAARREKLADLGARVMTTISTGRRDLLALGRALGQASAGGHLRMWSANGEEEDTIERLGLGGSIAAGSPDQSFHVAVENASANKLDYYLTPSIDALVGIDSSGTVSVRLRVTLTNTAPAGSPNAYVFGPNVNTSRAGEYAARVVVWAPSGAFGIAGVQEAGLDAVERFVSVQPGGTTTVEFVATLRNAIEDHRVAIRFVPQSRLQPLPLHLSTNTHRVHLKHGPPASAVLDRPTMLVWALR